MSSTTLTYIDNVITPYDSTYDRAAYSELQVNTKATTLALEVGADAEFLGNLKVTDPINVTNKYLLPNPGSLPSDWSTTNYYLALEDESGTPRLKFERFSDVGTNLADIAGISIAGGSPPGSFVYYEDGEFKVDTNNEYNTFNAKEEIIASDLSMLDYVLVSANKDGSGLGLYKLTLGNLVQSVQILASEISTIGSLTSNTKATADFDSIDFFVETATVNPEMVFDIKGLNIKYGDAIVSRNNRFSIGSPIIISGDTYYDASVQLIDMVDTDENGHNYEGLNLQRVNFGDSTIKNLAFYFDDNQEVRITTANTIIGQNIELRNSQIDLENSSLTLSGASVTLDQGLSSADDVVFNRVTATTQLDLGTATQGFRIEFQATGNTAISSPSGNTIDFISSTRFSNPTQFLQLAKFVDTETDTLTVQNAATFNSPASFNQPAYGFANYQGLNGSKIINSGVVELQYDGTSTEPYELEVLGGDVYIGVTSNSPNITLVHDTGTIECSHIELDNDLNVQGDSLLGGTLTVGSNYTSASGNMTLTNGNLDVTNGEITAATVSATNLNQGGSAVTASSLAYKENITSVNNGLDLIMNMKPVSYNRKTKTTEDREIGFIAEEMEKVLPTIVSPYKENKGIRYTEIIPVLVSALQEQQEKINELERKLSK